MADLVVVVPSRGRPARARALVEAFEATCTADTELVFAVDEDDPHGAERRIRAAPACSRSPSATPWSRR